MKKSKKQLDELRDKFETVENIGYELQEEGQSLVTYGKLGREVTVFLSLEYDKYAELATQYPELTPDVEGISSWVKHANGDIGGTIERLRADAGMLGRDVAAAGTVSTSGSSAMFSLHGHTGYIQSQNPERDIYEQYELRAPLLVETASMQAQLDQYLAEIDPHLSERRRGAWQTLNSVSLDKKAQAAHTMRDVLAKLISRWASNTQVKRAEWWAHDPHSEHGVSMRQRLRLLLFGPCSEIASEEALDSVTRSVDAAYSQDAYLKSVAHGSRKGTTDLVVSAMHSIESTMLLIIETRHRYFRNGDDGR